MNIQRTGLFLLLLLMTTCSEKASLIETLMSDSGSFNTILEFPDKFRLQVIYTQIDRDTSNFPSFTTHKFRINQENYFYPASTVKLPMAALALEKINSLAIPALTADSPMVVDTVFDWQRNLPNDSTVAGKNTNITECIRRIFLVSDNEAFNKLFEFVGPAEATRLLKNKGFENTRITHRLSIPLTGEQNAITAPVRFFNKDTTIYQQEALYQKPIDTVYASTFIGQAYFSGDSLIHHPMDFTQKNVLPLDELHDMLVSLVFPEAVDSARRFNLSEDDYKLIYKSMYQFPRESGLPGYDQYEDGYCKFLLYGGSGAAENGIRSFNKVGEAYGFLIDMAYIVDFTNGIEFILGAIIYVNNDEILNDDSYEYDSVGFPFFRDLGRVFYNYELSRPRKNKPDLSNFLPTL